MGAFRAVLKLSELPAGRMRAVSIDGRELLLCHTREGIFALDNLCTHAEARLCEGRLRGTRLLCPLHGGAFDVRDGRVLAGPAQQPLARYAVRIAQAHIEVAL